MDNETGKKKYVRPEILEEVEFEDIDLDITDESLVAYSINWY